MKDKIVFFLQQSIPFLIGVFIFFSPFPHVTAIKEVSFYLVLTIVLLLIIIGKIHFTFESPFKYPFLFYLLWAIFGLLFSENLNGSIHDIFFHLLKYFILYFLLINFFKTRKQLNSLIWLIFISGVSFSILSLSYFYGFAQNDLMAARVDFKEVPINIIGFVPIFAIILGIRLFSKEDQFVFRSCIILSIITMAILIFLTQSRGSLLGLFLPFVLLFQKAKKIIISLTVILLIIILFFPVKDRLIIGKLQSGGRAEIWKTYLLASEKSPVYGLGFCQDFWQDENISKKYGLRVEKHNLTSDPHNIFVSNIIRLGYIGLILYVYILFTFLKICWNLIRTAKDEYVKGWSIFVCAAFLSYLIKGFFEPALSHIPAIVFYTILAMLTILYNIDKKSPEEVPL